MYQSMGFATSRFLNILKKEKKDCFSFEEAQKLFPKQNQNALKGLLYRMVKKGFLMRIKKGWYQTIPLGNDPNIYMPNWDSLACL